jgi:hypothetical protein
MKKKESNRQTKKIKIWSSSQRRPDTKKNWPTDRRSQSNLKLENPLVALLPEQLLDSEWGFCPVELV